MNSRNKPKRVEKQSSTASAQSDRELITILQEDDQDLAEAKIRAAQAHDLPQERLTPPPTTPAARPKANGRKDGVTRRRKKAPEQANDNANANTGATVGGGGGRTSSTGDTQEDRDAREKAKSAMSDPKRQYANRSQAIAANYAFRDSEHDIPEDIQNLPQLGETSSELFANESVLIHDDNQEGSGQNRSGPLAPLLHNTAGSHPGAFRVGTSFAPAETGSVSETPDDGDGVSWADEATNHASTEETSQAPEDAASAPRNNNTGDILVEATLVPLDDSKTEAQQPSVIPEPELVTAEPMSETDRYEPREMIKNRYGRLWIFGLIAAVLSAIIVIGVAVGVLLGRKEKSEITVAPTMAPTSFLNDDLPDATRLAVETNGTSQFKAYEWYLKDQDYIHSGEGSNASNTKSYVPKQRFALASFYYATNGDSWTNRENWLDHKSAECDWATTFRGSICSPGFTMARERRLRRALQPDVRPYYDVLSLTQNNLTGTIPRELALLSGLDIINLWDNSIQGTLPTELGNLKQLTIFQVIQNEISGPIPSEYGTIPNLKELVLSINHLNGTIPSELGLAPSLKKLSLSRNTIEGTIPTHLGYLSNLQSLFLYENHGLTGPLPSEFGLLTSITSLQLYLAHFTGQLPSELGLITKMEEFIVSDNSLNGTIPSELGLANSLKKLVGSNNSLDGTIPTEVGSLTNLQEMSFHHNALTGQLPSEIGLMTSLTSLQLYNANLTGQLPSEIGQLTNIKEISIADNWNLHGSVPEYWANLTNLSHLVLHNTNLTGTIPERLCNATLDVGLEISVDCAKVVCNCSCICNNSSDSAFHASEFPTNGPTYMPEVPLDFIEGPVYGEPPGEGCNQTSVNGTDGSLSDCYSWSTDDTYWPVEDDDDMNFTTADDNHNASEFVRDSEPVGEVEPLAQPPAPVGDNYDLESTVAPPPVSESSPDFFNESGMYPKQVHDSSKRKNLHNIFDHSSR